MRACFLCGRAQAAGGCRSATYAEPGAIIDKSAHGRHVLSARTYWCQRAKGGTIDVPDLRALKSLSAAFPLFAGRPSGRPNVFLAFVDEREIDPEHTVIEVFPGSRR